jgi:sulfite exporter TauE/SafE
LTIWQAIEAIWGHRDRPAGVKRIRKRLGSAGRAVAYAAIAVAAISTLRGTSQSSDSKEEGWTARLLSAPFGRVLVIALGIAIVVLGVRLVRRGITKKFTDDLAGGVGQEVIRLGQAGYIVKGIAYVVVGGLFGWAAITYDAEKAGGLDDALRTVHNAPLGSILLTLMALGLVCFGVYCFFWARHPKVSTSSGGGGR